MPAKGTIQNGALKITYDFTELAKWKAKYPDKVDKVIRATGLAAEGEMKTRAAVDTGAMRASIYFVSDKEDNFGEAAGEAISKAWAGSKKTKGKRYVTSHPHPRPGRFTVNVGPSVDYAIYQEFGTSKMAAHPFVVPGAYVAVQKMPKLFKEFFEL